MQLSQIHSIVIGGLYHHTWEIPIEVFKYSIIVSYITAPSFILCNGFTKISILLFYRKIAPTPWFHRIIWATICAISLYTIIIASMLLFGCRPIRSFWVPKLLGTGYCFDATVLYMAIAVSNIASDYILFILPIPIISPLKMRWAQKLGALFILSIANFTVIISVIRLQLLPALLTLTDISWNAGPANVWSIFEANLFIICGSMPILSKFAKHFWAPFRNSSSRGPSAGDGYGGNIRLRKHSFGIGSATYELGVTKALSSMGPKNGNTGSGPSLNSLRTNGMADSLTQLTGC
ncbi:hypothetical protein PoMZ_13583 [Pyricularia oryzae]|uniref:Rhodopsin domain-containing protein n=1 Tax=Pyricularia oryzae TaxID=318829 RepID=A0A4P7NVQ8_PYROR|nr:hypothetical protein PoMZ_13583 [Pyricularia oryzae]